MNSSWLSGSRRATASVVVLGTLVACATGSCNDITVSLVQHIPSLHLCETMRSLTVAWNDKTALDLDLENLTTVEEDLFIFGLSNISSISFSSLTSVGGTLKVGALQASARMDSITFPKLRQIGGLLVVGDANSHYGDLKAVRYTASDGISIGSSIFVGGLPGSNIGILEISRLLSVGTTNAGATASVESITVDSSGTIQQIFINSQQPTLALDIAGMIELDLTEATASMRLFILGGVRSLVSGIELVGSGFGPVMVNNIPVLSTQDAAVCGGTGILSQGVCTCWSNDAGHCTPPPSSAPTAGNRAILEDSVNDGSDDDNGDHFLKQELWGFLPVWVLIAGTCGIVVLIMFCCLCWLRLRSHRSSDKKHLTVAGITEMSDVSNINIADLMWDDGLAAKKARESADASSISSKSSGGSRGSGGSIRRGPQRNTMFSKSTKNKRAKTDLMPEEGSVSFEPSPLSPSSPPPLNGHLLPDHAKGGSQYSGLSATQAGPRSRRPTPQASVGQSGRQVSIAGGLGPGGVPIGPSPKRKRSRKSVRAAQMRRPAQLAKRHASLTAVEESDLETDVDDLDSLGGRRQSNASMDGSDFEFDLVVPSALAREPTSGSQASEGSEISFISDTDGTASEISGLGPLPGDIHDASARPPPIALGRHPSLKHAPAGLLNAAIERERRKSQQLNAVYDSPTSPLSAGSEGGGTDDTYEVPAMQRSPRTGRAIQSRAIMRNRTMTNAQRTAALGRRSGSTRLPPVSRSSMRQTRSSVKAPRAPPRMSLKKPQRMQESLTRRGSVADDEDENPYLLPTDVKPFEKDKTAISIGGIDNSEATTNGQTMRIEGLDEANGEDDGASQKMARYFQQAISGIESTLSESDVNSETDERDAQLSYMESQEHKQ